MNDKNCTKCGLPMGEEEGETHAVCPTPAKAGEGAPSGEAQM